MCGLIYNPLLAIFKQVVFRFLGICGFFLFKLPVHDCAAALMATCHPAPLFSWNPRHLVQSWDTNPLCRRSLSPVGRTRISPPFNDVGHANKTRPWHASCLLILARMVKLLSERPMFTQETTAIAWSKRVQAAMVRGTSGHFFMSTKRYSTVKNTSRSNVQHI
jgi:hypothetical protein